MPGKPSFSMTRQSGTEWSKSCHMFQSPSLLPSCHSFTTEAGIIRNIVIEDTNWRTWTNRTNDGIMHEKGGECAILAYTNRGTIEGITLASGSIKADKDGAAGLVSINRLT